MVSNTQFELDFLLEVKQYPAELLSKLNFFQAAKNFKFRIFECIKDVNFTSKHFEILLFCYDKGHIPYDSGLNELDLQSLINCYNYFADIGDSFSLTSDVLIDFMDKCIPPLQITSMDDKSIVLIKAFNKQSSSTNNNSVQKLDSDIALSLLAQRLTFKCVNISSKTLSISINNFDLYKNDYINLWHQRNYININTFKFIQFNIIPLIKLINYEQFPFINIQEKQLQTIDEILTSLQVDIAIYKNCNFNDWNNKHFSMLQIITARITLHSSKFGKFDQLYSKFKYFCQIMSQEDKNKLLFFIVKNKHLYDLDFVKLCLNQAESTIITATTSHWFPVLYKQENNWIFNTIIPKLNSNDSFYFIVKVCMYFVLMKNYTVDDTILRYFNFAKEKGITWDVLE